jgi:hypothetical protein
VIATPYGLLDPEPEPGDAIIPRNLGRGPGFVMFNLRLNKTLAFGRRQGTSAPPPEAGGPGMMGPGGPPRGGFGGRGGRRGGPFGESAQGRVNLSFSVNVSNVLNHVNAGPPVGNLSSPQFGQATSSAGGFGFGRGGGPSAAGNRRIDLQARIGF